MIEHDLTSDGFITTIFQTIANPKGLIHTSQLRREEKREENDKEVIESVTYYRTIEGAEVLCHRSAHVTMKA